MYIHLIFSLHVLKIKSHFLWSWMTTQLDAFVGFLQSETNGYEFRTSAASMATGYPFLMVTRVFKEVGVYLTDDNVHRLAVCRKLFPVLSQWFTTHSKNPMHYVTKIRKMLTSDELTVVKEECLLCIDKKTIQDLKDRYSANLKKRLNNQTRMPEEAIHKCIQIGLSRDASYNEKIAACLFAIGCRPIELLTMSTFTPGPVFGVTQTGIAKAKNREQFETNKNYRISKVVVGMTTDQFIYIWNTIRIQAPPNLTFEERTEFNRKITQDVIRPMSNFFEKQYLHRCYIARKLYPTLVYNPLMKESFIGFANRQLGHDSLISTVHYLNASVGVPHCLNSRELEEVTNHLLPTLPTTLQLPTETSLPVHPI
jgi:hypothetical protein